jgi:hypothetical protein
LHRALRRLQQQRQRQQQRQQRRLAWRLWVMQHMGMIRRMLVI